MHRTLYYIAMIYSIQYSTELHTVLYSGQVRSGMPRRHFAALTFLLHSFGLFWEIARACGGPIDHFFI